MFILLRSALKGKASLSAQIVLQPQQTMWHNRYVLCKKNCTMVNSGPSYIERNFLTTFVLLDYSCMSFLRRTWTAQIPLSLLSSKDTGSSIGCTNLTFFLQESQLLTKEYITAKVIASCLYLINKKWEISLR